MEEGEKGRKWTKQLGENCEGTTHCERLQRFASLLRRRHHSTQRRVALQELPGMASIDYHTEVLDLVKALWGLKDAPRAFGLKLAETLCETVLSKESLAHWFGAFTTFYKLRKTRQK